MYAPPVASRKEPINRQNRLVSALAKRGLAALGRDRLDDVWAAALTGVLPEIRVTRPDAGNAESLDAERSRVRLFVAAWGTRLVIAGKVILHRKCHRAGGPGRSRRGPGAPPAALVRGSEAWAVSCRQPVSQARRVFSDVAPAMSLSGGGGDGPRDAWGGRWRNVDHAAGHSSRRKPVSVVLIPPLTAR
jgi:hypothetical protein